MKIGFTGTQQGMTTKQSDSLRDWIERNGQKPHEWHHGECIGADTQFHKLVRMCAVQPYIVAHPCNIEDKRVISDADYTCAILPPLIRNRNIALVSEILLAAPQEMEEILRSGTWATVRYARQFNRRILFFFIDGTVWED